MLAILSGLDEIFPIHADTQDHQSTGEREIDTDFLAKVLKGNQNKLLSFLFISLIYYEFCHNLKSD